MFGVQGKHLNGAKNRDSIGLRMADGRGDWQRRSNKLSIGSRLQHVQEESGMTVSKTTISWWHSTTPRCLNKSRLVSPGIKSGYHNRKSESMQICLSDTVNMLEAWMTHWHWEAMSPTTGMNPHLESAMNHGRAMSSAMNRPRGSLSQGRLQKNIQALHYLSCHQEIEPVGTKKKNCRWKTKKSRSHGT